MTLKNALSVAQFQPTCHGARTEVRVLLGYAYTVLTILAGLARSSFNVEYPTATWNTIDMINSHDSDSRVLNMGLW
jgi:hypothetical protein